MLTRIDAVQNIGGSNLLYLLDVPSKIELIDGCVVNQFPVVEPGQSECHDERVTLISCMHSSRKTHSLAVFGFDIY